MKKKTNLWKVDRTVSEFIKKEDGTSFSSMKEIVEAHNEIVACLQAEIDVLKEEASQLKYNILVKGYDRSKRN